MSDKLDKIARDFQRKMLDLGLEVTMQAGDAPPSRITTYCEKHGIRPGAVCPDCERAQGRG